MAYNLPTISKTGSTPQQVSLPNFSNILSYLKRLNVPVNQTQNSANPIQTPNLTGQMQNPLQGILGYIQNGPQQKPINNQPGVAGPKVLRPAQPQLQKKVSGSPAQSQVNNATPFGPNLTPSEVQNMAALGYTPGQTQPDVNATINSEMLKNGQDPFQLDKQPTDQLSQLLGSVQEYYKNLQNQPTYSDILNQARQQQGIPGLQNQYLQAVQNYNQFQNQLGQGVNAELHREAPLALATGRAGALVQQNALQGQNLQNQANVAQQALQFAQGNVGQNLQAQQAQQQYNLGLGQAQAGLATSLFGLTRGQFETYTNPVTGQPMVFNKNTGQFEAGPGGIGGQVRAGSTGSSLIDQYLQTASGGERYINEDKVAPSQSNAVKIQAAQLGIPILNKDEVSTIRSIDVTKNNLADLKTLIDRNLGGRTMGRIAGLTTRPLQDFFQTRPELAQIDSYREAAVKSIQALASGAGGLRVNQAEIDSAIRNLPTINDSLEVAQAKLNQVNTFLDNQRQQFITAKGPGASQSNTGQGGIIQTSVGPVNPNF